MRTSFHYQPEAQHPNSSAIHKLPADYPIYWMCCGPTRLSMSKAITKECMAFLKEASDMFDETGCVPGINGEPVPAERIVPDVKEYISETIDDPEATFDPEIWDAPGFALVLSCLHKKCNEDVRSSHLGAARSRST